MNGLTENKTASSVDDVLQGRRMLAAFTCELVRVKGKAIDGPLVIACQKLMGKPAFVFAVYDMPKAAHMLVGKVYAPDLGVPDMWCKAFAINNGENDYFAEILADMGDFTMRLWSGRKVSQ